MGGMTHEQSQDMATTIDSDDDFEYEEVEIEGDPEEVEEDEDLESALMKVRLQAATGSFFRAHPTVSSFSSPAALHLSFTSLPICRVFCHDT